MGTNFTENQQKAIDEKGCNILVAAAAGSGKTTVLVERIIQKIVKENIDIDRLLVVTFTNAAASEMRERILEALYKKIDENPENSRLEKQVLLLNKASICTIDSFCLDVIRNNFYEINISPNFRIADNIELEILKQETLDEVFEELYNEKQEFFEELVQVYTGYHGDEPLRDTVLKIFDFIQSNPFPEEWLEEKTEEFNVKDKLDVDFKETVWGDILIENSKEELIECINSLKVIKQKLDKYVELEKYSQVIDGDIDSLSSVLNSMKSWDLAFDAICNFKFKTWPSDKKINMQVKDEAKLARDVVKDKYKKMVDKTFLYDSKEAMSDIFEMYNIIFGLKKLVFLFMDRYLKKKQDKNIMDFSDIEHLALKILLKKDENGIYQKTDVAKIYEEKFKEIAIDEYQDSNLVQEYLLNSISNGKNIFMVGDVKQSIYKFRQARPELFLEKYENYKDINDESGEKIKLFQNFRSRKEVLNFCNLVFNNIMTKKLGDIDYTEEEYLNPSAHFEESSLLESQSQKTVLNIIDLKEDEENEDEEERKLEKVEIEAKFVAKKIKELVNSNFKVFDKKVGYRDITYKDIVILLRTTAGAASVFERELENLEIPVFSDSSSDYLNSIEIQTIISFLKVIDNPTEDIPLVTVLRSPIVGFDDNELAEIRLVDRNVSFYDSLKKFSETCESDLKNRVVDFLNMIEELREAEEYLTLDEFIWEIYERTDYLNYVKLMPNGDIRQANLRMLFERAKEYENISFKGLFNFIRYLERIKSQDGDLSSSKIIGESENVVRIMSIHKSKGLEFPVVFLSRADKPFNLRDLNDVILLHSTLGIGPKYINYERKIEFDTAAKTAIALKVRNEAISEEMRILYVALTRAKEKLIITGVSKDFEKEIEDKKDLLTVYEKEGDSLNHLLIKKYTNYLDWLEFVILNNENIEDVLEIKKIKKSDISFEEDSKKDIRHLDIEKQRDFSEITKLLDWEYEGDKLTTIPSKLSVSQIKSLKTEVKDTYDEEIKPNFMKNKKISKAEIGTLIHLCLQSLDLRNTYTLDDIEKFLQKMQFENKITEEERKVIDLKHIYNFINSGLAERVRNSKFFEKEKPFYINISTDEVYGVNSDETILVQGIIDLYFIDENDNVILVDYKTDYVKDEQILIDKYRIQLDLYKRALEDALGRIVDEVYIFSTFLGKEIKVSK